MVAWERFSPTQDGIGRAAFFSSCRDAIQAGAAPMHYGSPGYRLPLDVDGDGVACEPYRGR
ncbi:MAG: excalibur calcium-binding domain-containing protein [Micropepsaceae bacterium]